MPDRPHLAHPGDYPQLPAGFRFGTGSAAYQVEGGAADGGKGPSIWDTFTARPGAVLDQTTGDLAADHYHRHHEDVALLGGLGTGGYRFSVSWPRVQPTGRGRFNARGLDHYDRLVDDLLAHGQQPMATLYHWDLPEVLEDDGGWLNRATIDHFARYAEVVGERLGDRVEHWIPVAEPNVATLNGYGIGTHAPGRALFLDALPVAHHLLLAHGRAAIALRSTSHGRRVSVGCANNHTPVTPASRHPADVGATKIFDALWNQLVMQPMLLGSYPPDLEPLLDDVVQDGDLATIRQPLTFYGVAYDHPTRVAAANDEGAELPFELVDLEGFDATDIGRPAVPGALRAWLEGVKWRYAAALPPIILVRGGCATAAGQGSSEAIDDQARIDYLDAHLRAVRQAIDAGVDVRGFYVSSLLDGFEWADGWTRRCGLVHVDPATLVRTPKRSYGWYAEMIAAQLATATPAAEAG